MTLVFVPLAGILIVAALVYARMVARRADQVWHVHAEEVKIDDPAEVHQQAT
jgi:hypothetical protein